MISIKSLFFGMKKLSRNEWIAVFIAIGFVGYTLFGSTINSVFNSQKVMSEENTAAVPSAGDLPRWSHGVRAANRVVASLIDEMQKEGHRISVQIISRSILADFEASVDEMRAKNIDIWPAFTRRDYQSQSIGYRARRAMDRAMRNLRYYYPALALRHDVGTRAARADIDIMLLFWVPEALAATYQLPFPKVVYYGMPDGSAERARLLSPDVFPLDLSDQERSMKIKNIDRLQKFHHTLCNSCDVVANLSPSVAMEYAHAGHRRAIYVPNTWPMAPAGLVTDHHALQFTKLRICANIGRPAATGNTFGLHFTGTELLPILDKTIGSDAYEMHLFGHGDLPESVRSCLSHPSVKVRGFVDDIDAELCAGQRG
jgi:hypothetical protein